MSNIIRRLMDNMKLLRICILLLSHSLIFFRFYFLINVYMVLLPFNNVIYVFLLLWLCIIIVCLCMATLTEVYGYPDWGFSMLFPQLQGKCQGKTRKDGARPTLFLIFVLFYLLYVLCRSLYRLCVYMCTVLLPPGGYPIAVKYNISYHKCVLYYCHPVST